MRVNRETARPGGGHWSVARVLGDAHLRVAVTWLVALQLLDVLTTCIGLARGLPELNPITVGVLRHLGWFGLLLPKVAVCAAAVLAIAYLPRTLAIRMTWAFCLVMGIVVAGNVSLIV